MEDLDGDLRSIADIRERTMRAENSGDADFFESACTQDVVVMPPGMPVVAGRDAAVAFMRTFFDAFDLTIEYKSDEILIDGALAFDRGTYSQTLVAKAGGPAISESGNYVWVYVRESDDHWKMSRVIWNASEASHSQ